MRASSNTTSDIVVRLSSAPSPPQGKLPALRARLRLMAGSAIGGEAAAVYAALLFFADEHGRCWPSQRTLSDITHLDRRHLKRGVDALVRVGLLRREQRWGDDGGRLSDIYTLVDNIVDKSVHGGAENGAGVAPKGGAGVAPKGGAEEGAIKGETQKNKLPFSSPEGDADAVAGRLAPSCSPKGVAAAGVSDPTAYSAAIKKARYQGWLRRMSTQIGTRLRGAERDEAWAAVAEAEKNGRTGMSLAARRVLDRLDRQFRGSAAKRGSF